MTETVSSTAAPAKVSFWEDVIDIFISPADVFRRRQYASVWPPLLFVAISIGIITYATFNTLEPLFDAEFTRNTAKAVAANPAAADVIAKSKSIGMGFARYASSILIVFTTFLIGVGTWLLSKLVGARTSFHAALVVAAWAYMPRVLGAVLGGVQGLLMDPAQLTSAMSISIGPARFFDPDATNPMLLQVLGRFDLITVWVTILLAIGVYVTGRITKTRAAIFGVLIWSIGSLWMLRAAYMAM